MRRYTLLGILTLLTGLTALAQPIWKANKTTVAFTIKNAGFTVNGSFDGFAGHFVFDPATLDKAQLSATVETATVNTDNKRRDAHLKQSDYFNVAIYPRIQLQSIRITKTGTNDYMGTFALTIKGITRTVQVPFTFIHRGALGTFMGQFIIDRTDYGVGEKSLLLSNEARITLTINVEKDGVAM